jgi:hypothetical protein
MKCERCNDSYPAYGDGWDGLCPSCADLVSDYMDEHDVSREEAIEKLEDQP